MDNKKFLDWWKVAVNMHNYAPDPNDPLHYYDYKSAFESGHSVPESGEHWSSKFKSDLHPNRFVKGKDPSVNKPELEWWDTKYQKAATGADVIKADSLRQEFEKAIYGRIVTGVRK